VDIYTWIYIANLFVGFIAPVPGILIGVFSFVPTMRGLYIFATGMFTLKAVLTYLWTEETVQGKIRLVETKEQSILHVLSEYKGVFRDLLRSPRTLYTVGIMLVMSITVLVSNNFWSIFVTEKLQIATENLAIFPFIKSAIMLIFYFTVMPKISKVHFKLPMLVGFIGYVFSHLVLVTAPSGN